MSVLMKDVTKTYTSDSDILEHYGVKGMRWGVRKRRGKESRKLDVTKRADKDPDDMTTAELKALVEDMRLRQSYNQMVDSESVPRGKGFVAKALENVAKTSISIVTTTLVTKAVNDALARPRRKKG